MENENEKLVFLDKDEDIITIHLGKVMTDEQYNEVVNSVVAFMNTRWPELKPSEFPN